MADIEIYESSDRKIRFYIAHSDKKLSTGLLLLEPRTELQKHNRPALEQLTQIYGTCTMKLFDKNKIKKIILKEGDELKVPPNQYHIHSNLTNKKSITMWKAEGDITAIIETIRKTFKKYEDFKDVARTTN